VFVIDASQHFEKVKTQNYLRKEDITKIISTLQSPHSRRQIQLRSSFSEIAENDYNLNIPAM
jgi:type I restriction enzyme M protein